MAVLPDNERAALLKEYASNLSDIREPLGVSRTDLRAAVNALDDFLVANAAAINSAIPLPARTVLTTPQKARLLVHIIQRRYLTGA